jgi:D-alanyl-D-alanine carboxypeptidase/D-alanyl-D-alanine-endopeptidase (penicillin-binding protein 4)
MAGVSSPDGIEYELWDSSTQVMDTLAHTHIYTYRSPALSEIAAVTNKYSDNMFAETILRTIGKVSGRGNSTGSALKKEREILDSIAPGVELINQLDGSGLSRNASLCTEYYTRYLYGMSKTGAFDAFYNSLAVPGEAGTYRSSLKDVPTRSRLHLKSGSLSIARATAGYAGEGDDMLCFSLIVNRYSNGSVVKKRMEQLLEILSRYAN